MIRKLIRNKTILAVASILMGIYLVIARGSAIDSLARIIGYALIGVGAAYALMYLLGKTRRDRVQLYYAAATAVCGLLLMWLAPRIVNLLPMLMGLALIITGISNLTATRDDAYPKAAKIGPVVTIILGALVLFRPGMVLNVVVMVAGIALILNGLSELNLIRRIW